jgi:LmbE family N-acetylglucosaminyl deacetylase
MSASLDVLALAAHPDDVELCAGGTVCRLTAAGHRVGVVDFTRGELGSRGTPEGRMECRHPDHGAAARLSIDAMYYAGLRMVETTGPDGHPQQPWRPAHVLHYMQAIEFDPTFVVDVSDVWDQRIEALQAFQSQFFNPDYDPGQDEPETFISNPTFFEWIEGRARTYGYKVGATFGEPLLYRHGPVGVDDLMSVLQKDQPYR